MLPFFYKALFVASISNSRLYVSKYLISEKVTRIASLGSFKRFNSTKPHCNVGTIGHIDHGKTTLSSAITKVMAMDGNAKFLAYNDIDKSPEEKVRGITINACHLGYSSESRHYAHTDCPGHLSFIKNMIAGTSQMDGAILVVAATDGVMPQTREHILLTKQIGVKDIVVYINKADLVDEEMVELVKLEVSDLLDEMGYDSKKVPFISGSALCAMNGINPEIGEKSIRQLIKALDENVELPERKKQGQFVMPISTCFTVPNKGTVTVGTVTQGSIKIGDSVRILGDGKDIKTSVKNLQIFNKSIPMVTAGDNVGILLRGVKKDLVERGMFVCTVDPAHGSIPVQTECIVARCYIMTKEEGGRSKPIMSGFTAKLFAGLVNVTCLVELLPPDCAEAQEFKENESCIKAVASETKEGEVVMAMTGDVIFAKIYVNHPVILEKGQKFFAREAYVTAFTGVITHIRPKDRKRIKGFNWVPPKRATLEGCKQKRSKH